MQMWHDVEIIPDNFYQMDTCANEIPRVRPFSQLNILGSAGKLADWMRKTERGGKLCHLLRMSDWLCEPTLCPTVSLPHLTSITMHFEVEERSALFTILLAAGNLFKGRRRRMPHSRDLIVRHAVGILRKAAYCGYSDNKLGDTVALMGECVTRMCQSKADMQCCGNDRWRPAHIIPERCQADSYRIQLQGKAEGLRCNMQHILWNYVEKARMELSRLFKALWDSRNIWMGFCTNQTYMESFVQY